MVLTPLNLDNETITLFPSVDELLSVGDIQRNGPVTVRDVALARHSNSLM
jgi:hypothetical protein